MRAVIIGDSTHNTLSAVRSFGEAKIPQLLLLVCNHDVCFVKHSKYLKHNNCYAVSSLDDCLPLLEIISKESDQQTLITTFDAAAEWVDNRELQLNQWFRTPCRGKQLGNLFNKAEQCQLAKKCGFDVPYSIIFHRTNSLPETVNHFPIILKPLVSTGGTKRDIHICNCKEDFIKALAENSNCEHFLLQEYIEKEYEINAIGVATDDNVVIGGGIRKFRHWPDIVGTCSYGLFDNIRNYNMNTEFIKNFIKISGYHGPFSIELLHTKCGRNYFMEVNFRNDGLAYASTCAGVNLHALYMDLSKSINWRRFRRIYMMNYSIDFLHVKENSLSLSDWIKDFMKTRCFINVCFTDIKPTVYYYKNKIQKRLSLS